MQAASFPVVADWTAIEKAFLCLKRLALGLLGPRRTFRSRVDRPRSGRLVRGESATFMNAVVVDGS